jgi:release factor glutamine methyltransferase
VTANGTGPSAEAPTEPWTVLKVIRTSASWLADRGVESPRLDAEHMLAHALGTTRLQLYLQYDRPLDPAERDALRPLLRRRGRREPLQYVLGRAAFRELDLQVDPRVLIPRPETEVLVQVVLDEVGGGDGLTALDIGTGSGCIALSLLAEGPFDRVVAIDASADALEVARANAAGAGEGLLERVDLRCGESFGPLETSERFDVIVSNPPYVADGDASSLAPEIREWEPRVALFAGPGGFDVLDALIEGAPNHLVSGGLLALEVGAGQAEVLADRLGSDGRYRSCRVHRDWAGHTRIVSARTH